MLDCLTHCWVEYKHVWGWFNPMIGFVQFWIFEIENNTFFRVYHFTSFTKTKEKKKICIGFNHRLMWLDHWLHLCRIRLFAESYWFLFIVSCLNIPSAVANKITAPLLQWERAFAVFTTAVPSAISLCNTCWFNLDWSLQRSEVQLFRRKHTMVSQMTHGSWRFENTLTGPIV